MAFSTQSFGEPGTPSPLKKKLRLGSGASIADSFRARRVSRPQQALPKAAAAASAVGLRMEAVSRSADMIERKLASLEREYGHRRGLIGAEAAESRFEDAVFAFLVEDYERAATVFYTLVEAEALVQPDLAKDAEWYLAECLIEDGNMGTAVEAYQRIIDQGSGHPFFNDIVKERMA